MILPSFVNETNESEKALYSLQPKKLYKGNDCFGNRLVGQRLFTEVQNIPKQALAGSHLGSCKPVSSKASFCYAFSELSLIFLSLRECRMKVKFVSPHTMDPYDPFWIMFCVESRWGQNIRLVKKKRSQNDMKLGVLTQISAYGVPINLFKTCQLKDEVSFFAGGDKNPLFHYD